MFIVVECLAVVVDVVVVVAECVAIVVVVAVSYTHLTLPTTVFV